MENDPSVVGASEKSLEILLLADSAPVKILGLGD
jgi:hypothetical protein